jgi:hypothetical protein
LQVAAVLAASHGYVSGQEESSARRDAGGGVTHIRAILSRYDKRRSERSGEAFGRAQVNRVRWGHRQGASRPAAERPTTKFTQVNLLSVFAVSRTDASGLCETPFNFNKLKFRLSLEARMTGKLPIGYRHPAGAASGEP